MKNSSFYQKIGAFALMIGIFAGSLSYAGEVSFQILPPGKTITITQGDITKEPVDVIVNAANQQLLAGGGVCGAIFQAAGRGHLQHACHSHDIVAAPDIRCPFGQARITGSFHLSKNKVKHIIHAVGPDCRVIKDERLQDDLLKQAYTNSLQLADAYHQKTIAFPFISSAIYAFPVERAYSIAVQAVIDYFEKTKSSQITDVRFVLFSERDYELFLKTLDASKPNRPGLFVTYKAFLRRS